MPSAASAGGVLGGVVVPDRCKGLFAVASPSTLLAVSTARCGHGCRVAAGVLRGGADAPQRTKSRTRRPDGRAGLRSTTGRLASGSPDRRRSGLNCSTGPAPAGGKWNKAQAAMITGLPHLWSSEDSCLPCWNPCGARPTPCSRSDRSTTPSTVTGPRIPGRLIFDKLIQVLKCDRPGS
jgi:hypothetical protein